MANDLTCPHGRLAGSCEDCEYDRAKAAGLPVYPVPPSETRERNAVSARSSGTAAEARNSRKAR